MKVTRARITVRYKETDQMGIVHHSNYYSWFEVARAQFFKELGFSYRDMERRGVLLPLIKAECHYKAPARYDDRLTIEVFIEEFKGLRLTFDYKVFNEATNRLLAEGKTVHVFTDARLKPLNIKKKYIKVYEALMDVI
ncbi:MAG TPA: acyl-CoA thioesterase [Clostridiales bacterium]|nr:acyl-CoA thioesterase [Clostridiales bacterium]